MHHQPINRPDTMDQDSNQVNDDSTFVHGALHAMENGNQLSQDSGYSNDHWVDDMSTYNQLAMGRYGGGGYYMPSASHGLPSESIGAQMHHHHNQAPLSQSMHHQQPYTNQIPHGLVIPTQQPAQVPWPSMRTNPSQSYSAPPLNGMPQGPMPAVAAPTPISTSAAASAPASASASTSASATPAPITPAPTPRQQQQQRLPSITTSQPRKTLTTEDRRRMCLYHEEFPHVKQTDIGLKFGVERSTVSKTLRQKDRWLSSEDRTGSPIQKPKGRSPPNIELTLVNWVRGQQKKGLVVNDAQMVEKARHFCHVSDKTSPKFITTAWIEKFKQRHGVGPGKLIRRASETAILDSSKRLETNSPLMPDSQISEEVSPASPTGQPSSPPVSSANSDHKDTQSAFVDLKGNGYPNAAHSQSTTSLSSVVTDPPSSTFSNGAFSPTSNLTFSPDPNTGMFADQSSNFHRPRSQTFPNLEPLDYMSQAPNGDQLTPKFSAPTTAPPSALESPVHDMTTNPFGIDAAISPPSLRHVSSSGSLAGRSTASGVMSSTPLGSCPGSPIQEDTRRTADKLLHLLSMSTPGLVDQSDYQIDQIDYRALLRLTEKLRLRQQQMPPDTKINMGLQGRVGLSRIPEGDTEMSLGPDLLPKIESVPTR